MGKQLMQLQKQQIYNLIFKSFLMETHFHIRFIKYAWKSLKLNEEKINTASSNFWNIQTVYKMAEIENRNRFSLFPCKTFKGKQN